jgi:hypothetical protein
MDEAKKLGWHDHMQIDEGIRGALEKLVKMKWYGVFRLI